MLCLRGRCFHRQDLGLGLGLLLLRPIQIGLVSLEQNLEAAEGRAKHVDEAKQSGALLSPVPNDSQPPNHRPRARNQTSFPRHQNSPMCTVHGFLPSRGRRHGVDEEMDGVTRRLARKEKSLQQACWVSCTCLGSSAASQDLPKAIPTLKQASECDEARTGPRRNSYSCNLLFHAVHRWSGLGV